MYNRIKHYDLVVFWMCNGIKHNDSVVFGCIMVEKKGQTRFRKHHSTTNRLVIIRVWMEEICFRGYGIKLLLCRFQQRFWFWYPMRASLRSACETWGAKWRYAYNFMNMRRLYVVWIVGNELPNLLNTTIDVRQKMHTLSYTLYLGLHIHELEHLIHNSRSFSFFLCNN